MPPFTVNGTVAALPTTVEIVNVKYDDQGVDNADTTCVPKATARCRWPRSPCRPSRRPTPTGRSPSQGTPTAGGTLSVSGSGFKPNATVATAMYSTPQVLAVGQADASGTFSTTVTIPAGTTGPHTLLMSGEAPTGTSPRILTAAITVAAPPPAARPPTPAPAPAPCRRPAPATRSRR